MAPHHATEAWSTNSRQPLNASQEPFNLNNQEHKWHRVSQGKPCPSRQPLPRLRLESTLIGRKSVLLQHRLRAMRESWASPTLLHQWCPQGTVVLPKKSRVQLCLTDRQKTSSKLARWRQRQKFSALSADTRSWAWWEWQLKPSKTQRESLLGAKGSTTSLISILMACTKANRTILSNSHSMCKTSWFGMHLEEVMTFQFSRKIKTKNQEKMSAFKIQIKSHHTLMSWMTKNRQRNLMAKKTNSLLWMRCSDPKSLPYSARTRRTLKCFSRS